MTKPAATADSFSGSKRGSGPGFRSDSGRGTPPASADLPPYGAAVPFVRVDATGVGHSARREVAAECAVQIVFNGVLPYVVMMATPLNLEDFARGFVLTERLLTDPQEWRGCRVRRAGANVQIEVAVAPSAFKRLLRRGEGRAMSGRTGCGICGLETTDVLDAPLPVLPPGGTYTLAAIRRALGNLRSWQTLNASVRMLHAAAWADKSGRILLAREDVGRHNALDKLIGALHQEGMSPEDGFCLITSRCSFEMAQKAVLAGMRCLVAVSSPTARALEVAEAAGLTLLAQAREDGQSVFCGAERLSDLILAPDP